MGTMVDDEQNRVQGSRTGPVAEFLVKTPAFVTAKPGTCLAT